MKTCTKCGEAKPVEAFGPSKMGKGGLKSRCRPCLNEALRDWARCNPDKQRATRARNYQRHKNEIKAKKLAAYWANPAKYREASRQHTENLRETNLAKLRESQRKSSLKKNYGLTVEQYDDMLARQGGVCAICGGLTKSGRRLHVDHDHLTGKVRALLCDECNHGLAKFGEDPARMREAAAYIEAYREGGDPSPP